MKAVLQPTVTHEAMDFLALVSHREGVPLGSCKAMKLARQQMQRAADEMAEHTIYGNWAQAMFMEMVAALGRAQMIRPEDGPKCYAADADGALVPDYRVVFAGRRRRDCLVEVKNCHNHHSRAFSVRVEDMGGWRKYARLARTDFKIAVYFSRYRHWALLSPRSFTRKGKRHVISFIDAMKRNEMELLGDVMVGTHAPLSIRFGMQKLKSRKIKGGESCIVKIVEAGMYCRERKITDEAEQQIASLLILHGSWVESEYARFDGPDIITKIFEYKPEEPVEGQGFEMCDFLSRMFSRWYIRVTCGEQQGKPPKQIHARSEPIEFRRLIPHDYKGKDLPLWLFHVKPNLD